MSRPSDEYYGDLESRLRSLVASAGTLVEDQYVDQVEEFIDHGEYGVALSALAELLVETGVLIPDGDRIEIIDLATTMGIFGELPARLRIDPGSVEQT